MWGIQVLVNKKWEWLRPTGGTRYEYPTKDEAYHIFDITYPDQIRASRLGEATKARLKEIKETK